MTIRYDDRVAVVTGAGSGLGRSHALFLASRGAKVVVNDPGGAVDGTGADTKAADLVVDEIRAGGGEAVTSYGSVAEHESANTIVQTAVDTWGRIDILVNNAGILRDKTFAKLGLDDFDAVVGVHLLGSTYCTHAAWPHMREAGYGRIVMTTSAAGLYGNFGQANYGAAKLGLVGLMNTLKAEGKRNNVLVNTIAPVARTRMTEGLLPEEIVARLDPEYVTALVGWMCSEECEVTGEIVAAGAGHYARVQIVEAPGASFRPGDIVEPEAIAARWEEIAEMDGAAPQKSAGHAVAKLGAALKG